ncbi:MAG: hypothetical protein JNK24_06840 [Alphaproteobacteria bacterium]|nr:hypothetical protein [Alphaproteobacteria bacterium]
MNFNIFSLTKIFKLSPSAIFSLAVGVPLTFYATKLVFDWWDLSATDIPKSAVGWLIIPAIFIGAVAWVTSIINLIIWMAHSIHKSWKGHVAKKQEEKRAILYFNDDTSLMALEVALLVKQKAKGTKIFQARIIGAADDLEEKGILIRRKYINAIINEYEVPDFIWNHPKLINLLSQPDKVRDFTKLYDDWEKERKRGSRI